jgi:SAM-dependent methyltransferase
MVAVASESQSAYGRKRQLTRSYKTSEEFGRRYGEWNARRLTVMRFLLGDLEGLEILELGCGYGLLGRALEEDGARVTYVEGRVEHVTVLREAVRHDRVIRANLDVPLEYQFARAFDVVLHLGLLYHLEDPMRSIAEACNLGRVLLLESEVLPYGVVDESIEREACGFDQSLSGKEVIVSASAVERCLADQGFVFMRLENPLLETGIDTYAVSAGWLSVDVQVARAMWIACRREHAPNVLQRLVVNAKQVY